MGVKTKITLKELNLFFPLYHFTAIIPTKNGVSDTTYIVKTQQKEYILKYYERVVDVTTIHTLLYILKKKKLNVALCCDSANKWYLYEKLDGESCAFPQIKHIKKVATFLALFHNITYKKTLHKPFISLQEVQATAKELQKYSYYKYKKYSFIIPLESDGIIHGDMFYDNVVFDTNDKIGVFDFIDSADGSFAFDVGVALFGFGIEKRKLFVEMFFKTYNRYAKKKLEKEKVLFYIEIAKKFYGMKKEKRKLQGGTDRRTRTATPEGK